MITLRSGSPRSANAARMSIRPVSSPCDPAAGWSVTAGSPATSARICCELPHQLERALRPVVLLQRVEVAEARNAHDPLVDPRVVLHRAAAERVEARVDPEVAVCERGEVAHDLVLGHLGEARRAPPRSSPGISGTGRSYDGHPSGAPARPRLLEDELHQRVTSARTSASRSMSAGVRFSVRATSRTSSRPG